MKNINLKAIGITIFAVLFLIILYLNALNDRYQIVINDEGRKVVFDNWTTMSTYLY